MDVSNELTRKKLKAQFYLDFKSASSYKEMWAIKEKMTQVNLPLSPNFYYDLLYKCPDNQEAHKIKKEMEDHNIDVSEEAYIIFIKKEKTFEKRFLLLEEMENHGIFPSIKTYFTLIKYEENFQKALYLFNRMEKNYIEADLRVYQEILRKSLGSHEYKSILKKSKNYEDALQAINIFLSFKNINQGIQYLIETGQILDSYTISKIIGHLKKHEDRVTVMNKSRQEGMKVDSSIYWEFLHKTAADGLAMNNAKLLKELYTDLSLEEVQNVINKFQYTLSKIGGKGKFQRNCIKEEEQIHFEAVNSKDEEIFFFLLGKSIGINIEQKEVEEELELNNSLQRETDLELYKYELLKSKGFSEGLAERKFLKNFWANKKLPMLIINYIEDSTQLDLLYNLSITKNFYPFNLNEINKHKVSGCLFIDSIEKLNEVISKVDFNSYDVLVNILYTGGDNKFYLQYPESESWLTPDYQNPESYMLQFLELKKDFHVDLDKYFSSLYSPLRLKNTIQ